MISTVSLDVMVYQHEDCVELELDGDGMSTRPTTRMTERRSRWRLSDCASRMHVTGLACGFVSYKEPYLLMLYYLTTRYIVIVPEFTTPCLRRSDRHLFE